MATRHLPLPHPHPVLHHALLTSIVAPDAHLILRTHDHHLSFLQRLVLSILSSTFAYQSQKHKIRPTSYHPLSPDSFLSSLFLPLPDTRPRALVISGLEYASTPHQRVLARLLTDKRFQDSDSDTIWTLPDPFILVYICSLDPRERPNIHNSLLDKFAMSCNILLNPHLRHPPMSRTSSGLHSAPSSPLLNTHLSLPSPLHIRHSQSHTPSPSSPSLSHTFIADLRHAYTKTHLSPTLSLYLADLFSATRHHPQIDATLLSARCLIDVEKLARAARVVSADPTGVELLRGQDGQFPSGDGFNDDSQWLDLEDEFEMVAMNDSLQTSAASVRDNDMPVLDVTEVNIARIFPRCVSHRLRVRDGPREEVLAGAVFGATFGEEASAEGVDVDAYEIRPTIKDILISVMSEV